MTKPIDEKVQRVLRIIDRLHQIRYLTQMAKEGTEDFPHECLTTSRIEILRLRATLPDLLEVLNYDKKLSKI